MAMSPLDAVLPKRILVVRSLPGLGDMLCAVPALRALRATFPTSRIDVLGLPEMRWFGDRFSHLIDGWVAFPGYPGIPEGWQGCAAIPPFLAAQQANPYDLVLQLHGNGSYINPFVVLLGARMNAGFFVPGQFCPDRRSFMVYPEAEPEIWRLLRLLEFLHFPLQGDQLEFPVRLSEEYSYENLAQFHGLQPQSYVCIHPGAKGGDRRWPPQGFAAIADTLALRGYTIVLTGTEEERSLVDTVSQQMITSPVNLAGQTDLGSLALLLQQSALLVCNDTGISHLAAAMKTPSVAIFSNSELHRWAPLNGDRHRVVDSRQMKSATFPAVLAEAEQLLARQRGSVLSGEVAHVG